MKTYLYTLLFICSLIISSCSNSSQWSLAEHSKSGAVFKHQDHLLTVSYVTPSIVHVNEQIEGIELSKSLTVIDQPKLQKSIRLTEEEQHFILTSSELQVRVNKQTGSLTYLKPDGQLITSEKVNSRGLFPHQTLSSIYNTKVAFDMQQDEHIYGLGMQQDGIFDYRGKFAHLAQYNTVIAIPFFNSSKQYGILWDNYSETQVNNDLDTIRLDYDPYEMIYTGKYTVQESGLHDFVFEQVGENQKIKLLVNGKVIFEPKHMNHETPRYLQQSYQLQTGDVLELAVVGNGQLYIQRPSARKTLKISAEASTDLNYYFVHGESFDERIKGYRQLTGQAPMFGKWVYGFWQSQERFKSDQELLDVVKGYRKRNYPIDNIVLDWQYWGKYGWNALRFDEEHFGNMSQINHEIESEHKVHSMISVWPNFDFKTDVYREFVEKGYMLDYQTKSINWAKYYDPFNENAHHALFKQLDQHIFSKGFDALWIDGCEPTLAKGQGALHLTNTVLGSGKIFANTYSLQHTKGIYENYRKSDHPNRLFMLARSGFAGQQRYGTAIWSGDVVGDWDVFKKQISNGLSTSLSGIPYWTSDIGGFFVDDDQKDDYQKLYIRWFQHGCFSGIFRAHGTNISRLPWSFSTSSEAIQAKYINLRYQLMPYIYAQAHQVTQEGGTWIRPLIMDFADDQNVANIDDQYMFGPSIMVCPVTNAQDTLTIYLPTGTGWYDYWTNEYYQGGQTIEVKSPLEQIPLFVKEGSIIPMNTEQTHYALQPTKGIQIQVYAGEDALFHLYEDDGTTYEYEKGVCTKTRLQWSETNEQLIIKTVENKYSSTDLPSQFRVQLITPKGLTKPRVIDRDDQTISIRYMVQRTK